jgi:hypothetical protein
MNLLTLGDSFTYGQELSNRDNAWPTLVASLLGARLTNLASRGNSNPGICRQLLEYCTDSAMPTPGLVIIGWTLSRRLEFSDDVGIFNIWPGYAAFSSLSKERLPLLNYIDRNHDDSFLEKTTWYHNVILVTSFLKMRKIPYVMLRCQGINLPEYYYSTGLVDQSLFIAANENTGMVDWAQASGCKFGPGNHFLEDGHRLVADKVYDFIQSNKII